MSAEREIAMRLIESRRQRTKHEEQIQESAHTRLDEGVKSVVFYGDPKEEKKPALYAFNDGDKLWIVQVTMFGEERKILIDKSKFKDVKPVLAKKEEVAILYGDPTDRKSPCQYVAVEGNRVEVFHRDLSGKEVVIELTPERAAQVSNLL